ncbi:hypothetical protein [Sulfurimonas sp.]|uniref:hypothetical protein n=2 Tax=Sulfurimonas sp. TaxID=2022749 RepID=UPI003D0EAF71
MKNIIIEKGPILSSDIIHLATSVNSTLSQEAARKRLSRINGNIYKLKGLFSDRQILFYSKDIYPSERYYTGLREALKKAGKQYYTIIQSLEFHSGYMKKDELASYSINTVQPLKGHVTFDSALKKLQEIGVVSIVDDYVVLFEGISNGINNLHRSKGIEIAKNFLLTQFSEWSKNIGLVSFSSAKYYSEFGKYQFNFVAPSYIGTLPRITTTKMVPGFVVADFLIYNTINEQQIEFLLNKVSALKSQKNIANFIPFLIVDSMDTKALNKLKSKGIVVGFVHELFDSKYKDLLHSLVNLVTNAGAILKNNPDEYLNIVSNLNKLVEGKTNNLRGDLFELAVGYYQGRVCKSIDIGKSILTQEGQQREIDVFGITNEKIFICECKGYKHKVTKEEIEKWLGKNIPIIRKWLLAQEAYSDKSLVFEYWSTGGFSDDALSTLNDRKSNTTKYSIEYYDLDQIIKKSKKAKSKKFTEIIRDYYVKEI